MIFVDDTIRAIAAARNLCATDASQRSKLIGLHNKIQRRLMLEDINAPGTNPVVTLPVRGRCFSLPEEIEVITHANLCDAPIDMRTPFAQFAWHGTAATLDLRPNASCLPLLEDLGDGFPTYYDWPGTAHLMAISEQPETDQTITFVGNNWKGQTISEGLDDYRREGETCPIVHGIPTESPSYTQNQFSAPLRGIQKAVTSGYVHVYLYDPATSGTTWVSSLAPNRRAPSFRRYRLHGVEDDYAGSITAQVRLRWVEQWSEQDRALVQCLDAFEYMAKALEAEDRDPGTRERMKNHAIAAMRKTKSRGRTKANAANFNVNLRTLSKIRHA